MLDKKSGSHEKVTSEDDLYCCFIDDSGVSCDNTADYQIWYGFNPTPDDYTECCDEHVSEMLDIEGHERFEVLRVS